MPPSTDMTAPNKNQIATAMCSRCLSILCAVAERAGQACASGEQSKSSKRDEELRLHVMIRSRFIFR